MRRSIDVSREKGGGDSKTLPTRQWRGERTRSSLWRLLAFIAVVLAVFASSAARLQAAPAPAVAADAASLAISPPSLPAGSAGTPYTQSFSATGGVAPYTFSIVNGALPPGITLSDAGALSGTPTQADEFSFLLNVVDASGANVSAYYYLRIFSPIVLSPPLLSSDGKVGTAYQQTLGASGGVAPYTFAVSSGQLPAGLALASNGALSGTPTGEGYAQFSITATDARGIAGVASYSLYIAPVLTISPAFLANGAVGTAYSQQISASGGATPYAFSIAQGTLPAGLALSNAGLLGGIPTTAGLFSFTVKATDAAGKTSSKDYSVGIDNVPLILSPSGLPDGQIGVLYRQRLTVGGGTTPYVFKITDGALPPGVALSSAGALSGKPTTTGYYPFTVTVTDTRGRSGVQYYGISISQTPLTINPATLSDGIVGVTYRQRLTVSGGKAPYSFAIGYGNLPPGLVLSSDGWVRGRPTAAGMYIASIVATDSLGNVTSREYLLNIGQSLAIAPQFLPQALTGTTYSQQLTATGGTAPYTFSVTEGALPAGIALSPSGLLSGTPKMPGFFGFVVSVTDSRGKSGSRPYSLYVVSSITISPPELLDGRVGTAYSQQLAASGGVGPYTFAVTDGSLPRGLTLSASGLLSGTPTAASTYNFTVTTTDNRGITTWRFYYLNIAQALQISPPYIPQATLGEAYSVDLSASGGTAPYTFKVTQGSLPSGIILSSGGVLSGVPSALGVSFFTVAASDAQGKTADITYYLPVEQPIITLNVADIPQGQVGSPYELQFSASGGTAPYLFYAGSLPSGLVLSPSGLLHGTPTQAGSYGFVNVYVVDARGASTSGFIELTIAPLTIDPPSLPDAQVGAPYSRQLTANGGTAPYSFAISYGFGAPGLMLSRSGLLSGTPTTPGTYDYSIVAVDANGYTSAQQYQVTVVQSLAIAPSSLPDGAVGTSYNATLSAQGGVGPYSFAVTDGSLPPGVSLSENGALSGTPTLSGGYSFTVTLTDGAGSSVSRTYGVVIN